MPADFFQRVLFYAFAWGRGIHQAKIIDAKEFVRYNEFDK